MSIDSSSSAQLRQVNLIVSDMRRSLAFYRILGMEVEAMTPSWADHHRAVKNPGSDLTVEFDSTSSVNNWAPQWEPRTGMVLGFAVRSDEAVDRTAQRLTEAGHGILQWPHFTFFGARYVLAQDPDGNLVGIMGPIRPGRRWTPDPPA